MNKISEKIKESENNIKNPFVGKLTAINKKNIKSPIPTAFNKEILSLNLVYIHKTSPINKRQIRLQITLHIKNPGLLF